MAASNNASNLDDHIYFTIKERHDETFRIIDSAITLDEDGNSESAISKYEEGLKIIDDTLQIQIPNPPEPDELWDKAYDMVQNMKRTRKEVLSRIADVQVKRRMSDVTPASSVTPPSYEEAMASSSASHLYPQLSQSLQELKSNTGAHTAELIFQQDDVKIYFISGSGNVNSSFEHNTLRIISLQDEIADSVPKLYIEVGDWIYPLIPGVSPYFCTDYGAIIFPDVHSELQGDAVGIVLPEDQIKRDLFLDILQEVTAPKKRAIKKRSIRAAEPSSRISEGIIKGAQFISEGLIRGAEKAGDLMNAGTPKLMENITPATEPKPVNPKVSTGLRIAKDVTGAAVKVTGFVASRFGMATLALGRYLAPHIEKQGTKLLTSTFNMSDEEASKKVGNVLTVAAGAAQGFGTIYQGLEQSASILGSSLANNSVKLINHKYGQPMGEAAGETFHTVGNLFSARYHLKYFTPKGILKTTAKATGQALVEDYRINQTAQNNSQILRKFGDLSSEVD